MGGDVKINTHKFAITSPFRERALDISIYIYDYFLPAVHFLNCIPFEMNVPGTHEQKLWLLCFMELPL